MRLQLKVHCNFSDALEKPSSVLIEGQRAQKLKTKSMHQGNEQGKMIA